MKNSNIIAEIRAYLKTDNKEILNDLLEDLLNEERVANSKKQGGSEQVKRHKAVEKVLKISEKNGRRNLCKCWYDTVNYERVQVCSNAYLIVALKESAFVDCPMFDENEKPALTAEKFFGNIDMKNYKEVEYNVGDIKQELADFKAMQKKLPPKKREDVCDILIGTAWYNAEYFLLCLDLAGSGAKFYQKEDDKVSMAYLMTDNAQVGVLPLRKNK